MHRNHRVSAIQSVRPARAHYRKPTSRELDLLLLAGCSCLLTVLVHPVADAMQVASALNPSKTAITMQASVPTNSVAAFHLTVPPTRDEVADDDEA